MTEQDPEHYIKKLELLRELEGRNLLHSEVVIKYQDLIVGRMFNMVVSKDSFESEAGSPRSLEDGQSATSSSSRKHIFISYSHKDRKWLEKLHTILIPLAHQGKVHLWMDTQIMPGENWREEIQRALACARVAILLVTPNFLASDFIAKHELPLLLEAAKQEGLVILWIAVSASLYEETEIAVYQPINNPSQPLDSLRSASLNRELVRVCKHITKVANCF